MIPILQPRPTPRRSMALLALAAALASGPKAHAGGVPSDPFFSALRVDGTSVTGRLRGIDGGGGVVLAVGPDDDKGHTVAIEGAELVKLVREGSTPPPASDGGIILFPDGDRLAHAVIGPAGEASIEVQSFSLGTVAVPLDGILGLVFLPPVDPDETQALVGRVRDEPRSGELLWLTNGDRLAGGLLGLDDKKVAFKPAGGRVEIERSSVVALGFDPKLVDYPRPDGPYLELSLVDGSRLGVTSAQVDGGLISASTRYGQPIKVPVGELTKIHARTDSIVYLSDRRPTLDKYVSYIGPTRPVQLDHAVDGRSIRLGGETYEHGLGTQSRSYLVYQLDPRDRRFQATVGLDDRAGPLGSVVFRVAVNGKEVFASPSMSARETPKALDIDVSGAKTLVLITDFGDRGEVRDHADWAEARLIR